MLLIKLIAVTIQIAAASDDSWLCREEASQRRGNTIASCGIGTGTNENAARIQAFNNAQIEFNKVCDASVDCKDHNFIAEPKRTDCTFTHGVYKCYRLVQYSIQPLRTVQGMYQGKAIIKTGMSKKELFKQVGYPVAIEPVMSMTGRREMLVYTGDICVASRCHIFLENGKVDRFIGVKLEYTEIE